MADKEKTTRDAASSDADASSSPEETSSDESTAASEDSAAPAEDAADGPTRADLIARMAEKNELNAQLTRQNQELNDKWLRSVAEFENYRKRIRKEWELLKHQSRADVVLEILNVMDDFERAFAAAEEAESSGFVEGFRLIYNNLTQVMEKIGVKEIDAHNTLFDPRFHMAIAQIESEDLDSGVVAEVVLKGYLLDDIVIRPANVIVAK